MSLWHLLAGSPPPAPVPTVDLDEITAELSRRLGVLVKVTQDGDLVHGEILLGSATLASLPEEKIINRLERQLERAAALIKLG